jgi:bifunctional DNA-binding transcriptional regulator/antitoxin component of YhaV-PrlF toxin-antitoxin module
MKAYEFPLSIDREGKITIPEELRKVLPKNEEIRCIALVQETEDKKFRSAMNDLSQQEFSYHFPPNEAVYDDF